MAPAVGTHSARVLQNHLFVEIDGSGRWEYRFFLCLFVFPFGRTFSGRKDLEGDFEILGLKMEGNFFAVFLGRKFWKEILLVGATGRTFLGAEKKTL